MEDGVEPGYEGFRELAPDTDSDSMMNSEAIPASIKFFIWDFDGTLFDTYATSVHNFCRALRDEEGISLETQDATELVTISVTHAVNVCRARYGLRTDAFARRFTEYEKSASACGYRPQPNALEVCRAVLARGGRNFIFTHRDRSVFQILESSGAAALFEETVTVESGFKRKPAPDGLDYLIHKYALDRRQTIYVGDRAIDVQAARNAGIYSCTFDIWSMPSHEKGDFVYLAFEDMLSHLGSAGIR